MLPAGADRARTGGPPNYESRMPRGTGQHHFAARAIGFTLIARDS